ncbi:hypothetical protein F5B20DRAFT_96016 [Whalleya microplaca]|nr:hypothetical protein F5B20DRAFT_96016 [Whalleya microplaca]
MTASMDSLPQELLTQILGWVKADSATNSVLLPCLTVCKRWHKMVLLSLYRHVVLTNDNLELFVTTFNVREDIYIRSLTLQLTPIILPRYDSESITTALTHLGRSFLRLNSILERLDNLQSFALCVSDQIDKFHLSLPLGCIGELLEALPRSCVNLELDTCNYELDCPIIRYDGETHFCEHLRRVLPRMHHVRLHLSSVCHALLGTLPESTAYEPDLFSPIETPHLRSFLINCPWDQITVSFCRVPNPIMDFSLIRLPPSRWDIFTSALEKFAAVPNSCSPSTMLRIIAITPDDHIDKTIHSTLSVCDILSRTTYAYPLLRITAKRSDWSMRIGNGKGFISSLWDLETFAEGDVWKTLQNGARIPFDMAEREVIKESSLIEESRWRAVNPVVFCKVWRNEECAGTTVLDAEIRKNPATYTDLKKRIVESTPPGCYRPDRFLGSILVREGEEPSF